MRIVHRCRAGLAVVVTMLTVLAFAGPTLGNEIELKRQVEQLKAQLDRVTQERDEYRKELALLKIKTEQLAVKLKEADEKLAALAGDEGDGEGLPIDDGPAGPENELIVLVSSNEPPDLKPLQAAVSAQRSELAAARKHMEETGHRYQLVASAKEGDVVIDGEIVARRSGSKKLLYSDSVIASARFDATKAERSHKIANAKLSRLERELDAAKNTRLIVGQTESGKQVKITAKGRAVSIAKSLQVGKTYRVRGPDREVLGVIEVRLVSAVPAAP